MCLILKVVYKDCVFEGGSNASYSGESMGVITDKLLEERQAELTTMQNDISDLNDRLQALASELTIARNQTLTVRSELDTEKEGASKLREQVSQKTTDILRYVWKIGFYSFADIPSGAV